MKSNEPFSKEGFAIVGAAFEVHNELGGGLLEEIYQESFELELGAQNIPFIAQESVKTFYKDQPLTKVYIPDLVAFGQVLVELKATSQLSNDHEMQLLNYMRLCRMPVGYLINFGSVKELEWRRYILSEYLTGSEKSTPPCPTPDQRFISDHQR